MPVQINELIIRAHIKEDEDINEKHSEPGEKPDKEELIKECIERMMEILKTQNER